MSENLMYYPIEGHTKEGAPPVRLALYRHTAGMCEHDRKPRRKPVLLLHGASAGHQTFTIPEPVNGEPRCLLDWLVRRDFDPWLLDWRGSTNVLDNEGNKESLEQAAETYNFNMTAEHDIPEAIKRIRECTEHKQKVAVVGFCMGSGTLAEAVARGTVTSDEVDCIVLMTLGLFYETPLDGRLKVEDRVLERLKAAGVPSVDPRVSFDSDTRELILRATWSHDLEQLYEVWPDRLRAHSQNSVREISDHLKQHGRTDDSLLEMCNRLTFMYGMPYNERNLVEEIHRGVLTSQFGAIPIHMYIHGARNVRRGHATFYAADRDPGEDRKLVDDEARERFEQLKRVTLITGALNRLWHRDSIDLMHEWLCRTSSNHWHKFKKVIISDFGHQDLLWGREAPKEVFPHITEGLN